MEKTKQRELIYWLKQQSLPIKRRLNLLKLLSLLNGLVIITQAWAMAYLLQALIIESQPRSTLVTPFLLLIITVIAKALLSGLREHLGFLCGAEIRKTIRRLVLDRLQQLGPSWIQGKPAGSWATIILEQIEEMHDYYARYLPQIYLATYLPIMVVIAIFPINWAASLILLATAPLIPLFMALVGMGAADANRRNFMALRRLSGHFLDRLRGLETIRLFDRKAAETEEIRQSSESFRQRTMDVLKLAFLSSGVLEFFTSISIAVVAVYFGFSYLGELNFGHYGTGVTLFAGFMALILAPEFFQPLRDLGTFYHAKAQATGAADILVEFLSTKTEQWGEGKKAVPLNEDQAITITAEQLEIFSVTGEKLVGPLNFTLSAKQKVALIGPSGAGKSSLLHALMGFLPYRGSLQVNNVELSELSMREWRAHISWIGQNPQLPAQTIGENILLRPEKVAEKKLQQVLKEAHVDEFLTLLPQGVDTVVGDGATRLSVGQAQRIAVARSLLHRCNLLLLDEPTASLDASSEQLITDTLQRVIDKQTTLLITHRLADTKKFDAIWVMSEGKIVQSGDYSTLSQQQDGLFARLLSYRNREL